MGPEISVIVPLQDESLNVLPLAHHILQALGQSRPGLEVILVDDGSTDDTWQRILEACRTDPRMRGLRHARNAGQSAALWSGFQASRAPVIATLDGDLQNDPADFPGMLDLLTDADMVCGVRTRRADNWLRLVSSRIARVARKLVLGMDFADSGCNLRVFKRPILQHLPAFDGLHRFMPIFAQNAGFIVKQVPVAHHPRMTGRSKYGLWNRLGRGLRDLLMVRWFLQRQIAKVGIQSSSVRQDKP
jgi:dolichol-phosphate mannosyltransferase